MPEAAPRFVKWPSLTRSTTAQARPAAAAARKVFMNAWTAVPSAASDEPAEPQDAGADHDQRHGVRRVALSRPALALAEDEHRDQRRDAGVDVDGRAAGEVERATHAQPAAVDPLEDRGEHQQHPHGSE